MIIARGCKFVQRISKLSPVEFLDILMMDASSERGMSLLDYSNELQSKYGISISAQGVDDRFTDQAVGFMSRLLCQFLDHQISLPLDDHFLSKYSSLNLTDSTKLELPESLACHFPGFGGGASASGMSIQLRYDLKNQKLSSLDIHEATYSDSRYAKDIQVEGQVLELFDLGYANAHFLKHIIQEKSDFVCRLHTKSDVYQLNGEKVDFDKIYRWMRLYHIPLYEESVLVGEHRIPLRLVLSLVDEQTYQKRLEINKKNNRKKGFQTSEQHKVRMRFNMMLTNALAIDIPTTHVYLVYKLRWQVELIFKTWKSGWNLDKLKDVRYGRYMCLLYAKLLLALMGHQIYGVVSKEYYECHQKILSIHKCVKTIRNQIDIIRQMLGSCQQTVGELLVRISNLFARGHVLSHKKNSVGYSDLFVLFICKSEKYG